MKNNSLIRKKTYTINLYNGDYFVVSHLQEFIKDSIMKYVRQGLTVGDIGCGEQPFSDLIKSMKATYLSVDVAQNSQGTVDVIASITEIPLTDASLDLIICTEVLEHVSDTYKAFEELSRLIKPGGFIIITVPFTYPLHEEPFDFVRLTPHQIMQCAKATNLNVVEIHTSGNELEVVATVLDNMWMRMNSNNLRKLFRIMGFISRIVTNSVVIILSKLLKDYLPQKYYLNTLCVLGKGK